MRCTCESDDMFFSTEYWEKISPAQAGDIFIKILFCWVIQQRRKHSEEVRYHMISTLHGRNGGALGSASMFNEEEQ